MQPNRSDEVPALRPQDGALEVLDQRLLPGKIEYNSYSRWDQVAGSITRMEVRGAPAIGIAAAFGLALAADLNEDAFDQAVEAMKEARPTAVNLMWAAERLRDAYHQAEASQRSKVLWKLAETIAAEDLESCQRMGDFGADLVPPGAGILTHCNAGGLATGGYGTAVGVIRSAFRRDPSIHVYVDETRPYLQGARLTAFELHHAGIPQTLITDNMAASFMQKGKVQFIVTGADRIAANGDAANKIGTYGLAVLARYHHIPFYIAAPLSTFDLSLKSGDEIPIEERSSAEVTHLAGVQLSPEGVEAAHPGFDVTPASLIQGLITEVGVLRPPFELSIRAAFEA